MSTGHDPRARKRTRRALAKLHLLTSANPLIMKNSLLPIVISPGVSGDILRTHPVLFSEVLTGSGDWVATFTGTLTIKARGGGGGGSSSTPGIGYAGGGGGEYRESDLAVTSGNSYPYSCGAGGAAAPLFSLTGDDGGDTSFNTTTVIANGGSGGSGTIGGAGGTGGTGTIGFAGGAGGDGFGAVGQGGAGGGSSGDEDGVGNAGAMAVGTAGGAGGAAVDDDGAGGDGGSTSVGEDGEPPGGGGGGGSDGMESGDGADGQILLEWNVTDIVEAEWAAPSSFIVSSVSNIDGTLTISPNTGAVIASINLAHANLWTGQQSFTKLTLSLTVNDTFAFTLTTATP